MNTFNYEKAYCLQVVPTCYNLNNDQKNLVNALSVYAKDLQQKKDLNIPLDDKIKELFNDFTCQEISEVARVIYFAGHWQPSLLPTMLKNATGQSWKVANLCDQMLRERLQVPFNIQIHEGKLRVTFSNKDCWLWDEFGLATEKNFEIFKNCGLPFGENTLESSAKKLIELCGDLWPDVENLPDNDLYLKLLEKKKKESLRKLQERNGKKLKDIEKDIEDSKKELEAFQWLIEHSISIENCIYYAHIDQFCFGWRNKLDAKEKELLTSKLADFPFQYSLK
jgi:hypothetical protein